MKKEDYIEALRNMDREALMEDLKEIWESFASDNKEHLAKLAKEAENIKDFPATILPQKPH